MRLFRRKSILFRLTILSIVCMGLSALPIALILHREYSQYQSVESEYLGVKFLNQIAIVANISHSLTVSDNQKKQVIAKATAEIEKLFDKISAMGNDSFRKNARGKVLFSKDMISSFPTARDRGVLILEMCSYISVRSGIYNDAYVDTHVLSEACGELIPRIYAGYFEIARILDEWNGDKKSYAELSYLSANLKDDSKELIASLKRISTSSESINYSNLLGGLNQFNVAADDLDSALGAWRDENFDIARIRSSLLSNEKYTNEIWQAAIQVLGESLKLRQSNMQNMMIKYAGIYLGTLFFCGLFAFVIIAVIQRSMRNTVSALKLAAGGMLGESLSASEKNSFECHDEIARIDEYAMSAIKMFRKTLDDVKNLAAASEEIELATENFSKRERPHYESMETSISQIYALNSSESAHLDAMSGRMSELKNGMGRIGEELSTQADALTAQSHKAVIECNCAQSFSENISQAKACVEKLETVAKIYSEIAERANLLALNLSIETERASLKGTGIDALIGQIRELALRTSVSVMDIISIREAIMMKLGGSLDDSEKISEMSNAHKSSIEGLADSLKKTSSRISTLCAPNVADRLGNSREEIAFSISALRKNMDASNGVLEDFSLSTKKSLEEFARILEMISIYK